MTKTKILLAGVLVAFPPVLRAQPGPGDPVRTVYQLFDAMRSKDTAAIRSAFHPDARLMGPARDSTGTAVVRVTSIDDFVSAIGSAQRYLDERLTSVELRQDGDLATVWADYAFYADTTLSHCGVDAFQLARVDRAWKIIQVADTRRREGCADTTKE